jgi:hypothetical protein
MRKLIITALMAVIAVLSVSSVASADVPRCQASVPSTEPVPTTFSVYHPRAAFTQWENTWQHTFNVMIDPVTGEFSGSGSEFNRQDPLAGSVPETISGTYNSADKTITFTAIQSSGGQYPISVTNLKADTDPADVINTGTVQNAVTVPVSPYGIVETKVTEPHFTVATTDTAYANHGEYVSAIGGGKISAQKCVGMPTVSKKGQQ